MTVDYNDESYNYKSYWFGRSYEHNAEVIALKKLLPKKGEKIIDIGGGFGRLLSVYRNNFDEATILEPSKKLLEQMEENVLLGSDPAGVRPLKILKINADVMNISKELVGNYDCAIMIRVSHHLEDLEAAVASISKLTTKGGVFIFEFANKMHFLNVLKNAIKLNFRFFSKEPYKLGTFTLWHPAYVKEALEKNGFRLEEKLSVSNFRSPLLKKAMPENILLVLEDLLQGPLSCINFGPSVFVKAVKISN